jgi:hypothetical protein
MIQVPPARVFKRSLFQILAIAAIGSPVLDGRVEDDAASRFRYGLASFRWFKSRSSLFDDPVGERNI